MPIPLPPRPVRGRTRPGRLRALDAYWQLAERALLQRDDGAFAHAPVLDVGVGDQPWTTCELAQSLASPVHPGHPERSREAPEPPVHPERSRGAPVPPVHRERSRGVIGFEQDAARLEAARAALPEPGLPNLELRLGGFADVARCEPRPRLVRALNVLRAYPLDEALAAHALLGAGLLEGGALYEGSSDEDGALLTALVLRRDELHRPLRRESLVFCTDLTRGFAPLMFRDWLPRDLRRGVRPGTQIHAFFEQWTSAWQRARSSPDVFSATAAALAHQGSPVRWLRATGHHVLVWAPAEGVLPCTA